jgi:UPF0271 protein
MSRGLSIDLNADVGEGCGHDGELIPLVSSVNIACGVHAGDEASMGEAVELALRAGAAIGAHPGLADREHFGRREIAVGPREAQDLLTSQIDALRRVASPLGARVGHLKLHGAFYNMAARDRVLASAVVDALFEDERRSGGPLVLFALAGSLLHVLGRERGLRVVGEAFADRCYREDGSLVPRSEAGAVIEDEGAAADQAMRIAREGLVLARDGRQVAVDAGTLCLHGDTPRSVTFARRIRREFEAGGIRIESPPQ